MKKQTSNKDIHNQTDETSTKNHLKSSKSQRLQSQPLKQQVFSLQDFTLQL